MKKISNDLGTPVYLKTGENDPWPEDKTFYLLTASGLFLCRNHQWFRSCSPASEGRGPSDLAEQNAELELSYPIIPRALVEKAVAFFRHVYDKQESESALIVVYNRLTDEVELVCPDQTVSYGSVNYKIPSLPPHQVLIGDFHSHCNFSPEPSMTDENDELNRPGMHLIAGYLKDPKPSFHCIVVADGTRFKVKDHSRVMAGFHSTKGVTFPKDWLDKVKKKKWSSSFFGHGVYDGDFSGSGGSNCFGSTPSKEDEEKIQRALDNFLTYDECPTMEIVRTRLFACTRNCSYNCCEKRAKEFIEKWPEEKAKYEAGTQSDTSPESSKTLLG